MTSTRGLRPLALLGAWLLATLAALPAMASRPAFDRQLDQELAEAAGCPLAVVSCPNPELGTATAAVGVRSRMARVDLRFYIDPATGEPHIYEHGVSEEEVEEVLSSSREERPGRDHSRVVIGSTAAGRVLRVVYSSDPYPGTLS